MTNRQASALFNPARLLSPLEPIILAECWVWPQVSHDAETGVLEVSGLAQPLECPQVVRVSWATLPPAGSVCPVCAAAMGRAAAAAAADA